MSAASFHGDITQRLSISNCATKKSKDAMCPPALKINRHSHVINKKLSTTSALADKPPRQPQQQRRPVIIYTQTPKVIHTNPKEFMELVQNLTGLPKQETDVPPQVKPEIGTSSPEDQERKNRMMGCRRNEDSETSSIMSDGHSNCSMKSESMDACLASPILSTFQNPYMTNFPVLNPDPASYYLSDQSINSYTDSIFFSPDVCSSLSTLEDIPEFQY